MWTEREHEQRVHISVPLARPTVKSDVITPALQALLVGLAIGVSTAILLYLVGVRWPVARKWGSGLGVLTWAFCAVWFVLQHRSQVVEPIRIAWARLDLLSRPRPAPKPRPPLVINPLRSKRPAVLPVSQVIDARPVAPGTFETTAPLIVDEPDSEIAQLYQFIRATWAAKDVTRDGCRKLGYTRSQWEKYIGGSRAGKSQESSRGILDRGGAVFYDGHAWRIRVPASAAMCISPSLREYARVRRDLGQESDRTGRDNTGGALQLFRRERGGER